MADNEADKKLLKALKEAKKDEDSIRRVEEIGKEVGAKHLPKAKP